MYALNLIWLDGNSEGEKAIKSSSCVFAYLLLFRLVGGWGKELIFQDWVVLLN